MVGFKRSVLGSRGDSGSGVGHGGGSGGSIREAGGKFGEIEAAAENAYFRKLVRFISTRLMSLNWIKMGLIRKRNN